MRVWADEVEKASNRAAQLPKQLLAFSRRQVTSPKVIDLSELIKNLLPMLSRLIGETVSLRMKRHADLCGVLVDPGQAEQIVVNLVINARDAMPSGGEILIETSRTTIGEDYPHARPQSVPGDYVVLTVDDTGCGMLPHIRERIFEPFFTTKDMGSGTGLGLSMVFGIVEQARGWVEVNSEVGVGTSLKAFFPCTDRAVEHLAATPLPAPIGGQETVLLVEDDQSVRELAINLLERLGYVVLSAANGDEALALCREGESIQAMITDVIMPGMNGKQLADAVTKLRPEIGVLFTSGYPRDVISHHGVLDQGLQFLPKPYSLESLAAQVRGVLDGKST